MLRSTRSLYAGGLLSAVLLVYLAYACFTKNHALRDMEVKLERMVRTRDQVTAQLQVVTDHRQRLEQSIEDYKNKLQTLKEESAKQRDNLEAAADSANRRMQLAEKSLDAVRLDYRRALDQLRNVKDDEIQRLQESLSAQRRWCQQLKEKFDTEYIKPKGYDARSVQIASRNSDHIGVPAATVAGSQMVAGVGDGRSKAARGPAFSADSAVADPFRAHAAAAAAAVDDDSVRLMPRGQRNNGNDRWPAAVKSDHEDGYAGRQVARLLAAEDEPTLYVQGEQSAFQATHKFNMPYGGDAAQDRRQRPVALARSDRDKDDYLEERGAEADRDAVVGDYNEPHRRRQHDAEEIAGELRELNANAIRSPDRVSDEVGKADAIV